MLCAYIGLIHESPHGRSRIFGCPVGNGNDAGFLALRAIFSTDSYRTTWPLYNLPKSCATVQHANLQLFLWRWRWGGQEPIPIGAKPGLAVPRQRGLCCSSWPCQPSSPSLQATVVSQADRLRSEFPASPLSALPGNRNPGPLLTGVPYWDRFLAGRRLIRINLLAAQFQH